MGGQRGALNNLSALMSREAWRKQQQDGKKMITDIRSARSKGCGSCSVKVNAEIAMCEFSVGLFCRGNLTALWLKSWQECPHLMY